MGRYQFYAPGLFKAFFLLLTDRLTGSHTPLQWITDRETGRRFPLDESEKEVLDEFLRQLEYFHALPKQDVRKLIDRAIDAFAEACLARRAGDPGSFEQLQNWETEDWRSWCHGLLAE